MKPRPELQLELRDTEWPQVPADHDRQIVRAIVTDGEGYLYFVRVRRDDDFGKAVLIETSGGGVEPGEEINKAIYHHWGFTEYINTGTETYPDGTVIEVEFYGKRL